MTEAQAKAVDAALELLMERMASPSIKEEVEILHDATNAMAQLKAENPTTFNRPTSDPMQRDWDKLYALCDDNSFPAATSILVEKGRALMEECQRSMYPPDGSWIVTRVREMYEAFCNEMANYQG